MKARITYSRTAKLLQDSLIKKGFVTVRNLAKAISEDPACHFSNLHSVSTNIGNYFIGKRKPAKNIKQFLLKYLEIDLVLLNLTIKQDETLGSGLEKNPIDSLIKNIATLLTEGSVQNICMDKLVKLIEIEISLSHHCKQMKLSPEQILLILQEEDH